MKIKKVLIGSGGVILLGIVSSALWDALKPAGIFLFKLALNFSTLGIEKFKDKIYLEIAKGLHEGTSLELFVFAHSMALGFILSICISLLLIRRRINRDSSEDNKELFLDKIVNFHKDFHKKRYFVVFLVSYILFTGTILSLTLVREKYINNAATHFEQLHNIISPYIVDNQRLTFKSSFAQIKNRDDYADLITAMEQIAEEKNLAIPEFNFTF